MSATFFNTGQRLPGVLSVGNGGGGGNSGPTTVFSYIGNQDITPLVNGDTIAYSDSVPGWSNAAFAAAINLSLIHI